MVAFTTSCQMCQKPETLKKCIYLQQRICYLGPFLRQTVLSSYGKLIKIVTYLFQAYLNHNKTCCFCYN